ncbi:MAG: hypothetical protein IPO98_21185 [Saprospiraceae bacterium]|nr:hypothetical protein [Saprospiraceae bacterium]
MIYSGNNFDTQNGAPFLFKSGGKYNMMMGTEDVGFTTYSEIEGNVYKSFQVLSEKTGNIRQGRKVTCSLADIDNDGFYEMAVGNERGGLAFFNTTYRTENTTSSSDVTKAG